MSKHKPALPERLYYRLADAARLLGCSADDLLHYGACGYLEITACADRLWAQGSLWRPNESNESDFKALRCYGFVALFSLTLIRIEKAGYSHASMARCVYSHTPKGLVRASLNGALPEMLEPYENLGFFNISKSPPHNGLVIGEAVKFSTIDLWVRTEELIRFQKEGSSHVRTDPELPRNYKKPHGNAENHARNREAVLKAAIAVKANSPDLCGETNRDWAKAIDEKARLFWPDGEPPLKLDTIERLLGDCMKLPDGK